MNYFDNAATTKVLPEVADMVVKYMVDRYGNTSSLHHMGVEAEKAVKQATTMISKRLACKPNQIIYTSGSTEGNHMAIVEAALSRQQHGKHLVTTSVEHPSVLESFRFLETQGFDVTYLDVDQDGRLNPQDLLDAISKETQLISVMFVNNETGVIQPVHTIGQMLKNSHFKGLFHTDATQAIGKVEVNLNHLAVDLLTASAHKFHGPKGIGFLYSNFKYPLKPIFYGGGHQGGYRPGTLNTPGITGMALALNLVTQDMDQHLERLKGFRKRLVTSLEVFGEDHKVMTPVEHATPHIVSFAFKNLQAEVILHSLEQKNIYVSSGSACSSNKHKNLSHVLKAMKIPQAFEEGAIRVSMSQLTTEEEVDALIKALHEVIPDLYAITKRRKS